MKLSSILIISTIFIEFTLYRHVESDFCRICNETLISWNCFEDFNINNCSILNQENSCLV